MNSKDNQQLLEKYRGYFDPTQEANDIVFCGRENDLSRVCSGINDNNSFSIIGGRRIGKTSFLKKVGRELSQKETNVLNQVIPVYITFQEKPTQTSEFTLFECYKMINREVIKAIKTRLLELDLDDVNDHGYFKLKGIVEKVSMKRKPSLKIVLLLDEINSISELEWKDDFYANLRALISTPTYSPYFNLIASSVKEEYLRTGNRTSTLEHVVHPIILETLKDENIKEMLNRVLEGKMPDELTEKVLSLCGGHPYILHFIMNRILKFDTDLDVISNDDLEDVKEEFLYEREGIVNDWLNYFDDEEKKLLFYFVKTIDESPKSFTLIKNEFKDMYEINPRRDKIKTLISFGFVRKEKDYYSTNKELVKLFYDLIEDRLKELKVKD